MHEVFDNGFCVGETPDHSADMTILVKTFCTSSCEEGFLVTTELVDLLGDVAQQLVVVQLLSLSLRGLLLRRPLRFLHGKLSAVFGSVNTHACTFKLSLLG